MARSEDFGHDGIKAVNGIVSGRTDEALGFAVSQLVQWATSVLRWFYMMALFALYCRLVWMLLRKVVGKALPSKERPLYRYTLHEMLKVRRYLMQGRETTVPTGASAMPLGGLQVVPCARGHSDFSQASSARVPEASDLLTFDARRQRLPHGSPPQHTLSHRVPCRRPRDGKGYTSHYSGTAGGSRRHTSSGRLVDPGFQSNYGAVHYGNPAATMASYTSVAELKTSTEYRTVETPLNPQWEQPLDECQQGNSFEGMPVPWCHGISQTAYPEYVLENEKTKREEEQFKTLALYPYPAARKPTPHTENRPSFTVLGAKQRGTGIRAQTDAGSHNHGPAVQQGCCASEKRNLLAAGATMEQQIRQPPPCSDLSGTTRQLVAFSEASPVSRGISTSPAACAQQATKWSKEISEQEANLPPETEQHRLNPVSRDALSLTKSTRCKNLVSSDDRNKSTTYASTTYATDSGDVGATPHFARKRTEEPTRISSQRSRTSDVCERLLGDSNAEEFGVYTSASSKTTAAATQAPTGCATPCGSTGYTSSDGPSPQKVGKHYHSKPGKPHDQHRQLAQWIRSQHIAQPQECDQLPSAAAKEKAAVGCFHSSSSFSASPTVGLRATPTVSSQEHLNTQSASNTSKQVEDVTKEKRQEEPALSQHELLESVMNFKLLSRRQTTGKAVSKSAAHTRRTLLPALSSISRTASCNTEPISSKLSFQANGEAQIVLQGATALKRNEIANDMYVFFKTYNIPIDPDTGDRLIRAARICHDHAQEAFFRKLQAAGWSHYPAGSPELKSRVPVAAEEKPSPLLLFPSSQGLTAVQPLGY